MPCQIGGFERGRFPKGCEFTKKDYWPDSDDESVCHHEAINQPLSPFNTPSMYLATNQVGETLPKKRRAYPDLFDAFDSEEVEKYIQISAPAVAYGTKPKVNNLGYEKLNSKQFPRPIGRVQGLLPDHDNEKEILGSLIYSLLPRIFHAFLKKHIQLAGGAANSHELIMGSRRIGLSYHAKIAAHINDHNLHKKAYAIFQRTLNDSQILIPWSSDRYPDNLRAAPESPLVLFVKGDTSVFTKSSIAVVGTRSPSRFGCFWSNYFSEILSKQDVCIISGLAHGIDSYAHSGAILGQGCTIGVLGHGLDTIYPFQHKGLAHSILDSGGALVSRFAPGIKPEMFHFPERNKVIAGLSDSTLVIEANEKGGAMITAKVAHSMGRPVFAFGNRNPLGRSSGCENLIKDGIAARISRAKDLFNALRRQDIISNGLDGTASLSPTCPKSCLDEKFTEVENENPILNLLRQGHYKLEILAQMLPHDYPLADAILDLELTGLVRRQGAGLVLA